MSTIYEYQDTDLSGEQVRAVVSLLNAVWPRPEKTVEDRIEAFVDAMQAPEREGIGHLRFVIWEGTQAIAHARTFERIAHTAAGPIAVMALSGVCVASTHRGQGLGAAMTRKAFERVDRGVFPVSLFQTLDPAFYEKLGARLVQNRFVNS